MQPQISSKRLIKRPAVESKTTLSRSFLYEKMNPASAKYDPEFPKPIKLGEGKNPPVAWDECAVDAWIERQIAKSRQADEATRSGQPNVEQPNLKLPASTSCIAEAKREA